MKDNSVNNALLKQLASIAKNNNNIQQDLYSYYNVKRGLRNSDGTGVLVGLTEIGDVHGYIIDENEKVPVPGKLHYRGIDVEELVQGYWTEKRFGYEEVCYLLLFGELPDRETLDQFSMLIGDNRYLPKGFMENMIFKSPTDDIMNGLARSILASYSYDKTPDDTDVQNTLRQCIELIARFPVLVAYVFQTKEHNFNGKSLHIHNPIPNLSTAENFLHLIRPDSAYTVMEAEVLDLCLILHAEHGGGNNSTFTIHVVSSSDTDTYSAMAAGVGSLKGPKHGGANIKVMKMMEDVGRAVRNPADKDRIADYIQKLLEKEAYDGMGLIYGFGHAVYTRSDPRCTLLKDKARQLAEQKGMLSDYQLYDTFESLVPEIYSKFKKTEKPICSNVDFYSGLVYRMLDIPVDLYTPLFAIARIAGWSAHRIEEIVSGGKIIRPAYKNVSGKMIYVPLDQRGK
ncbi:MAG: citrate/2-methylcitrate synthase [Spirochaetales bacterium]|nr:citrate/2-methylcitrate synthase [Spirochaetales bacterium]